MTKKVLRPFWQYEIPSTEKWLAAMADSGWQLQGVGWLTNVFSFQEASPQSTQVRIDYQPPQYSLPSALIEAGWMAIRRGNWLFHFNSQRDVQLFPPREAVKEKLRRTTHYLLFFLVIAGLYSLVASTVAGLLLFSGAERVPAPYPILDIVPYLGFSLTFLFLFWLFYAYTLSRRTLQIISVAQGFGVDLGLVKASNRLIQVPEELAGLQRVTKLFWEFNHVHTTQWLEKMAARGMHLKHVAGKRFYFAPGKPLKVRFFLDSQRQLSPDYFDLHAQAGFKLHFDGQLDFGRFLLWSRAEGNGAPGLYSDQEERKAGLKRLFWAAAKSALFWILLGSMQLYVGCSSIFVSGVHRAIWLVISSLWLLIIVYRLMALYFSYRTYRGALSGQEL